MCWRGARSASWLRRMGCIAAGSTSFWAAIARRARGARAALAKASAPAGIRRRRGWSRRSWRCAASFEAQGYDAGAQTLAYHLAQRHSEIPSVSTIWRILRREGLVVAEPRKRPRCSLTRFQAELPNEMWQADVTAWQLASGEVIEILNQIDDHSRLFLGSDAYGRVKAPDVVAGFHKALPSCTACRHRFLSDNGAVFTGSYRGGKVLLEYELERLGIEFKNSRPYHPQTCGKVERLHQTLKRYLAKQPPAKTRKALQHQLDTFVHYYNYIRPHRALGRRTPLQAYSARLKARPAGTEPATYFRVRNDRVDTDRQDQPSLRQPPLQNRGRQSPQRPPSQAPHRRPADPRDRPPRRTHPRAHARPKPQIPAAHRHMSVSTMSRDICLRCPGFKQMPGVGFEPTCPFGPSILSRLRIPIPPPGPAPAKFMPSGGETFRTATSASLRCL